MKKIFQVPLIIILAWLVNSCSPVQVKTTFIPEVWNINIDGFSEAYFDEHREAYAINTITQPTDQWGAAETVFEGEEGVYSMVFTSRCETDGEPTYKVLVNNREVLVFTNPRIFNLDIPEYEPYTLVVPNIPFQKNDLIRVEFLPHSNGLVPEGEAFGFARARWKNIVFEKQN